MVDLTLLSAILFVLPPINSLSPHPKLLLISMDGFRNDLVTHDLVPNIYAWASRNLRFTKGVRPQYVSYTAPNHLSMTTGLYEESHGIVSNFFYELDEASHTLKSYDYWNYTEVPGIIEESEKESWYFGEPIWITNEKTWTRYQKSEEWIDDINTIIELFTRNEDPVNFLAWYIDEPDTTLHKHGFTDGVYLKTLAKLDEVFERLIDQLNKHNLINEINVILTADHGHAQIKGINNILCVKDYVDSTRIKFGLNLIYTADAALAYEVYNNLTEAVRDNNLKINVYMRNDFPDKHFYKGRLSRIGEVILEAEVGYEVDFYCTKEELNKKYDYGAIKLNKSTHGQDPHRTEMHAVLIIGGPKVINYYETLFFPFVLKCGKRNATIDMIAPTKLAS
ncbi:unnamed protein product [Haemonchus placei]|uniref:Bis(5'-adenosyl)-triphosphatase n=1 Tax=Haemonchus placei TaxID=6290 RepID=A0A158QMN3_HAEPC|nr:unnamed protein product [Haemonchus placei]